MGCLLILVEFIVKYYDIKFVYRRYILFTKWFLWEVFNLYSDHVNYKGNPSQPCKTKRYEKYNISSGCFWLIVEDLEVYALRKKIKTKITLTKLWKDFTQKKIIPLLVCFFFSPCKSNLYIMNNYKRLRHTFFFHLMVAASSDSCPQATSVIYLNREDEFCSSLMESDCEQPLLKICSDLVTCP